jgi:energy-coupling factor transporter transmembrane protein EcfT
MTRLRWLSLAGILVISLVLAFFLREVVYGALIVPLAYLFYLGKYYYTAIPQLILWIFLLLLLLVFVAWNFIPEVRPAARKARVRKPAEGQVEALTLWIHKARKGNYFKWQLANRLGRISRRINELSGQRASPGGEAVEKYLDAGLNHSFVDFPTSRNRFQPPVATALDLDPKDVVDYLESQLELRSDRHS